MSEGRNDPSLRELEDLIVNLQKVMDERDRRYEDRFTAMDEKTSLALAGSEKAVSKAETATEKRFDSVNEFRGTLNDQAATLLPRAEANARFDALDAKNEDMKAEISSLRDSRSTGEGKDKAGQHNITTIFSILAIAIAVVAILLRAFGK